MRLNSAKSKKHTQDKRVLNLNLLNNNNIVPSDIINSTVNSYSVYERERMNCENIRLVVSINTIASNVLFNRATEIVYGEGSDYVELITTQLSSMNSVLDTNSLYGRKSYDDRLFLLDDTQISNLGFEYHCGLDIFGNHILRNKTNKVICKRINTDTTNNKYFNTIYDFFRNGNGNKINISTKTQSKPIGVINNDTWYHHLYDVNDLLTFDDCVYSKLENRNGWYGFKNKTNLKTIYDDEYEYGDLNKVICNRYDNEFIELYPTSDLFSFTPKYNTYKSQKEDNWKYYLTYPSKNIKNGISFISEYTNSLKAILFEDNYKLSNGTNGIKIYSISKHGLSVGNNVNIYDNDIKIIENAEVVEVYNEYEFSIYTNEVISDKWVYLTQFQNEFSYSEKAPNNNIQNNEDIQYKLCTPSLSLFKITNQKDGYLDYAYIIPTTFMTEEMLTDNLTINHQNFKIQIGNHNISYKRVVNNEEVEYYVRQFTKLSKTEYNSEIGNMSFAKNIYGDNISEIVYTEDIDISGVVDNLNRPLTSIYITLLKNNTGYKEWYGSEPNINDKIIEFSHAFGKLNCGFVLSDYTIPYILTEPIKYTHANIKCMSNLDGYAKGMNMNMIRNSESTGSGSYYNTYSYGYGEFDELYEEFIGSEVTKLIDNMDNDYDEINVYGDNVDDNFFGDLCCFSTTSFSEMVIDDCMFRFNTAQRESENFIDELKYNKIVSSDFTNEKKQFRCEQIKITNSAYANDANHNHLCPEGYYYKPHHEIKIHSYSLELEEQSPNILKINDIVYNESHYDIQISKAEYFEKGDKIVIIDNNNIFDGFVSDVINSNIIHIKLFIGVLDTNSNTDKYIVRPGYGIPSYAKLSMDGTFRYFWRNIIKNGFDDFSNIEKYPFTNGAFYIQKPINLFVRRQDDGTLSKFTSLSFSDASYEPNSAVYTSNKNDDIYYNESNMSC